MMGLHTVRQRKALLYAASLLTAIAANAAEPQVAQVQSQVQVDSEVLIGGPSVDEYFELQRERYDTLTAMLPDGILNGDLQVQVTPQDLAALAANVTPKRIGVVKPVDPAVGLTDLRPVAMAAAITGAAGGALRDLSDGGYVWARAITSEGAGGIRVHLTDVSLPAGVDLYFFSPEGEAFGPYHDLGPNGDGEFWTEAVLSPTGILVLEVSGQVKPAELRQASLTIVGVGHIDASFVRDLEETEEAITRGAPFCGNPSCVLDATCHNDAVVSGAKNAVAKMEWVAGAFLYTCTGGLLADTVAATQIPYFLTANHCLSSNNTAQNVNFYWFYKTASCGGSCPNDSGFPRTIGSTVKATGSAGDFTLLQCTQTPPAGAVFLGWNNAAVAFTNGAQLYRISHPNFGAQAFAHHQVDTSAPTCTGWPRGERIYSRDVEGATDGGSSGSPVLNASGQVVGQLSGACGFNTGDPCDSAANATVDGALAFYWSSVDDFLNPTTCQPSTEVCNDGLDNDCDNLTDCADPNCAGSPSCPSCGGRNAPCDSNDDCCSNRCRPNGRCR